MRSYLKLCICFVCLIFQIVSANDNALFIGLREYSDSLANLDGPKKDVRLIKRFAKQQLGFTNENIQELLDSNATLENIHSAFQNIVDSSTAEDSVMIYFSGRGTQIQDLDFDEKDRCDEALYLFDMSTFSDDLLSQYLKEISAKEILVILDTSYYSSGQEILSGKVKSFPPPNPVQCDLDKSSQSDFVREFTSMATINKNIILLTAANQISFAYDALSAQESSLFTYTFYTHLTGNVDLFQDNLLQHLTETGTEKGISKQMPVFDFPKYLVYNDLFTFNSDSERVQIELKDEKIASQELSYDSVLDNVMLANPVALDIYSSKTRYKLGQEITFTVKSPTQGYLYIFDRGADQSFILLFPSKFSENNYVFSNEQISLPGSKIGNFKLKAGEPKGGSRIFAVVVEDQIELLQQSGNNSDSNYFVVFEAGNTTKMRLVEEVFLSSDIIATGDYFLEVIE